MSTPCNSMPSIWANKLINSPFPAPKSSMRSLIPCQKPELIEIVGHTRRPNIDILNAHERHRKLRSQMPSAHLA
jgi:hypothetical protein